MDKILFVDTETGGLDPVEYSLLSIGLVVWENGNILQEMEIFILDDVIKFSPKAIGINKIDFLEFVKIAIPKNDAIKKIEEFCKKNFGEEVPVTIAGHNVGFDISFLKYLLKGNFNKLFSHRSIDTSAILKFLFHSGIIVEDCSSSDKAFKLFDLSIEKRHSALGDARATAQLYSKLINLVRNPGFPPLGGLPVSG